MGVKRGYKQTEVGVIPEEWEVRRLEEVGRFLKGRGVRKDQAFSGDLPCIRYGEIYTHHSDYIKSFNSWISQDVADTATKIRTGDLLFAGSGETKAEIGKCVAYIDEGEEAYAGGDIVILRLTDANSMFMGYYCNSAQVNAQKASKGQGDAVVHITSSSLASINVVFPPLPEQRAIADALSDVDALLAAQDRLIAKKRDLKQSAMQQLLTGRTRLPGFRGEWEVRTLGDLGSTFGGLTGKTSADFGNGSGQYITFMNVMSNVVIDCSTFERVRVAPGESQNQVRKGDLLFNGSSETPEEVAMCAVLMTHMSSLFLNSFCFGFRFREDADADGLFMAYFFRSSQGRDLMKSLAQGSTRYNVSKSALLSVPFRAPPLPEQRAIAAVLADMDALLAALEARREKTRALKQGMMQDLLTGRVRLV